jgi:hypothetical protein
MKLFSLRDLLTKLFSFEEFLQFMKLYYSDLQKEKTVVSNFMQCEL